jgi:hypothetical protein
MMLYLSLRARGSTYHAATRVTLGFEVHSVSACPQLRSISLLQMSQGHVNNMTSGVCRENPLHTHTHTHTHTARKREVGGGGERHRERWEGRQPSGPLDLGIDGRSLLYRSCRLALVCLVQVPYRIIDKSRGNTMFGTAKKAFLDIHKAWGWPAGGINRDR